VSPLLLIAGAVGGLLVAALLGLFGNRGAAVGPLVYLIAIAALLVVGGTALLQLLAPGGDATLTLPIGLPALEGDFQLETHFRLDALSAFFLLILGLAVPAVSLFAIGYGHHGTEPARVLAFYPLFLAGMVLVLVADDAFAFLVAWEFMSLASWLLVLANHRADETRRAAYVYLVMASMGTAALLLAFGLLAGVTGDYRFAAIRAGHLTNFAAVLVVLLTLIGAGSKAGLVPLHAWLPLAHPAAPSQVSALMSGAMTKIALYAIIRLLFDLVGPVGWWVGVVLLVLGGASAVMGVLYGLWQRDLKTLLAYSTVENIGIIAIGLGLAQLFRGDNLPILAALALTAALFHCMSHAMLKSLLFCGAGAVLNATGLRDIERLGALIHRMPVTAVAVLVGAAGLSALPPLNGFVSEWLTFQAILAGAHLPQWALKFGIAVIGALLALTAALAAALFVRAYGIVFLGRPRSAEAAGATEVQPTMRAALVLLAAACVLFGVLPFSVVEVIAPVTDLLLGQSVPRQGIASFLWFVPLPDSASSYSGIVILLAVSGLAAIVVLAVHRFASSRVRRAPAWDCGFPDPRPQTQYSADSLSQPLRRVFGPALFQASEHVDMPPPGDRRPARLEVRLRDLLWDWLYAPVAEGLGWFTERINGLQFLTIRRYLTFMFAALSFLLAVVAVTQ
jgi:formate hydrogenlyase subunit 3/multisubunit Na+/H+ antiporter MnhD subunit